MRDGVYLVKPNGLCCRDDVERLLAQVVIEIH